MQYDELVKAINARFLVSKERIEVFVSPDKSSAIVLSDPAPEHEQTGKINFCECESDKWPFNVQYVPSGYLEEGFFLHSAYFPSIPLNIVLARMKTWSFVSQAWQ